MRLPIAILALTGCVPHAPQSAPPPPPAGSGYCDAAPAQGLVGREASPALAAEAQRLTGARTWRWLRPGQIVTMEYRADRLNLHLDAGDKVARIVCG
jgi:hypothetical protein